MDLAFLWCIVNFMLRFANPESYTSVSGYLVDFFNAVLLHRFIKLLILSEMHLFIRYEIVNGEEFFLKKRKHSNSY
jgi:hypothetical protein